MVCPNFQFLDLCLWKIKSLEEQIAGYLFLHMVLRLIGID